MPSDYFIFNGDFYLSDTLIISPDNRSFKYGDGFFETMKMIDGNLIFQDLHCERLFSSLQVMQFDQPVYFTNGYLLQQIQKLVSKNNHESLARIRINIFRGNGGLYDNENNQPNYIIQSWSLPSFPSYNQQGLSINIYKEARKTADAFSHVKSNNYLPYAMASLWSKKNNLDDALIINCQDRIAEATTSNIFLIKDNIIKTPALSEGCVAGVIRRHLLQCFQEESIQYTETWITEEDIEKADEIFLTNSGFHIQWVKQCGNKFYINNRSGQLHAQFIAPLFIRQ